MFVNTVYANRRTILKNNVDKGIIWLTGLSDVPANYTGNTYPFVQDSTFLYYTGIKRPQMHMIIDIDGDKTTIYGDDYSVDDLVWIGDQRKIEEWKEKTLADETKPLSALSEDLVNAKSAGRTIHITPPYRQQTKSLILEIFDEPLTPSQELIDTIIEQRLVKEDREIMEIEYSVAVAAEIHHTLMENALVGVTEGKLLGLAAEVAHKYGVDFAYNPIITIDGQVLHKLTYENTLQAEKLLLCDVGVSSIIGYASDITRTTPTNKLFESKQKEIYEIVLTAQKNAILECKPGVTFLNVHLNACRSMIEGLKSLTILKGDTEEILSSGAHALFFPHGLGHALGLDVHDMEALGEDHVGYGDEVKRSDQFGLNYLRSARTLEYKNVMTVEPGLYFIPSLFEMWRTEKKHSAFINYEEAAKWMDLGGVRIEDNVMITKTSSKILGPPIAKELHEIQTL